MHILYLCQLIPYPPDAGPKVRSYYLLRYLAQYHDVTLLAFSRPDDHAGAVEHLKTFCNTVYTVPIQRSRLKDAGHLLMSLAKKESFVIRRDSIPAMTAKVDELLGSGRFEAVHADQLWMAQYALRALRLRKGGTGIRTVLDEHNACFQIVQRLANGEKNALKRRVLEREWRALQRFEAEALRSFDRVVTVTEEDRRTLQSLMTNERAGTEFLSPAAGQKPEPENQHFCTIPICVDTQEIKAVKPAPHTQDILHLGTMFWLPNVEGVLWFARQVWPKVQASIPTATFTIIGKQPPAEISALGTSSRWSSGDGPGAPAIRVTGYIADPQPYLEQAGVFIVPLLSGSGMRVKIVDGWRWGLPVVSTTIGAEGIRYRNGENILIADDAETFSRAVVRVLDDPLLAQSLRTNGRRWVEEHYDWQRVYQDWDAVYAS